VALACLGIAFAVGAAEITPPDHDAPGSSASQRSAVDTETLDGLVGYYRLNDRAVLTVSRDGQQLTARLTGQNAVPIQARSTTEFSYKDGSINFIAGPDGRATSLTLHRYGVDVQMTRIDAATAQLVTSIRPERPARELGALIILR